MTFLRLTALFSALLFATAPARAGAAKGSLIKQASVTRSEAAHIALSQVEDGKIVHVELKKVHGKIIWFFDISRPGTKAMTQLQVDAKSGNIVSTSTNDRQHSSTNKRP